MELLIALRAFVLTLAVSDLFTRIHYYAGAIAASDPSVVEDQAAPIIAGLEWAAVYIVFFVL